MEKKPPETLPDAELDVMMALWDIGRPAIVSEMSTPRYSGLISGGWTRTGFWSVTSGSGSVKVMPGLISAVTAEEGEGVSCRRRAPRVPSGMAAAPASRAVS